MKTVIYELVKPVPDYSGYRFLKTHFIICKLLKLYLKNKKNIFYET